jgi:transcriptional repressor NrdR
MTCPICGGDTKVIDSRSQEDSVWRRRKCVDCKERFSTTEIDLEIYKRIIKNAEEKK